MKSFRILLTASFLTLAAALSAGQLRAQDDTTTQEPDTTTVGTDTDTGDDSSPSFDYFYNALQDQGQWLQIDPYGYVFQPNAAASDPNWQPYTDGYWAYTDAGWTWVSYEDFGWITYHYGRWAQVQDVGWVWVPDYQWGPAWVSWRVTRDLNAPASVSFIGWAPLPPEAQFRADIGVGRWVDAAFDIGPGCYTFCRSSDFGAPVMVKVLIPRTRNVLILNNTVNITNIVNNNNTVYNGGPGYSFFAKRVTHPIPTLHLVRQTDPKMFRQNGPKGMLAKAQGNQLFVSAPVIVAPKKQFKPEKVAKVIEKPVITKGWAGVDPKQKQQLQTNIKAQTKGIKINSPATPVSPQALAVIPKGSATPAPSPGGSPGGKATPGRKPGRPTPPEATPGPNGSPAAATPTPPGGKPTPRFGRPTPPGGKPTPPANPAASPAATAAVATPVPSPSGKPRLKPLVTPGPGGGEPPATPTPHPKFTPNPGVLHTPLPTPSARPTVNPNAEAIKLQQEKAAAAAAAAARSQQTPPPKPTPPPVVHTPPPVVHTPPPVVHTPPPGAQPPAGGQPGFPVR
ncbi:MAG TPA: DUF6600 domain-containing protein, partial [Chthoniobacteraceae bacterium]|nr:DUF6600 domain-containing protein [Chthoniobacteraceae bacterium]